MSHSISFSDDQVFHLSNANISYLFRVSPEGLLEHVYFGNAIPDYHIPQKRVFRSCTTDFHGVSDYSLSDVSLEYPFFGASDNRVPAILLRNPDGGSTNIFKYKQHRY